MNVGMYRYWHKADITQRFFVPKILSGNEFNSGR
jgi:hypothetical protein